MNNKKLMWILLAVIIVFAGFNIFTFFNNQQNYEQVEFSATYSFERGNETKIENEVLFAYEKESDLEESMEYFNGVSIDEKMANYKEVLSKLEEQSDRPIEVLEYDAVAYKENGLLRIEEVNVVTGMVKETENGWITDFGENRLELKENSNSKLVFILPEDAKVISAEPEPTEKVGNVLTWKNVGEIKFPNVEYQ
jgi:hypothetical protein